jgi:hypothetical protein
MRIGLDSGGVSVFLSGPPENTDANRSRDNKANKLHGGTIMRTFRICFALILLLVGIGTGRMFGQAGATGTILGFGRHHPGRQGHSNQHGNQPSLQDSHQFGWRLLRSVAASWNLHGFSRSQGFSKVGHDRLRTGSRPEDPRRPGVEAGRGDRNRGSDGAGRRTGHR